MNGLIQRPNGNFSWKLLLCPNTIFSILKKKKKSIVETGIENRDIMRIMTIFKLFR